MQWSSSLINAIMLFTVNFLFVVETKRHCSDIPFNLTRPQTAARSGCRCPQFSRHKKAKRKETSSSNSQEKNEDPVRTASDEPQNFLADSPQFHSRKVLCLLSQSEALSCTLPQHLCNYCKKEKTPVSQNTITDWGKMSSRQLSSKLQKEGGKKKET